MILYRILKAYANLDTEIGYTQGMNFIAAAIIYCLNPENDKKSINEGYCVIDSEFESKVFWIFVHIMYEKQWREVFQDKTPKLMSMLDKFCEILKEKIPDLYQHFIINDVMFLIFFIRFIRLIFMVVLINFLLLFYYIKHL